MHKTVLRRSSSKLQTLQNTWTERVNYLHWFQKPTKILPTQDKKLNWFAEGKLNLAYNCLEPQLKDPKRAESPALYYANLTSQKDGFITYKQLAKKVNKYVQVLKNCGVEKGSRVYIYMPNIMESVFTVLACGVIGATYDYHYYGDGINTIVRSLKTTDPSLIITASCILEGDGISQYKSYIDKARKLSGKNVKCLVIQRDYKKITNLKANDIDFDDVEFDEAFKQDYEKLDSNDHIYAFDSMVFKPGDEDGLSLSISKLLRPVGPYMVGLDYSMHRTLGLFQGSNMACLANLASPMGLSYSLYGPMLAGSSSLILEDFSAFPESGVNIINKYKLKNMLIHSNLFEKSFEQNNDILEQMDLDYLGFYGKQLDQQLKSTVFDKCRKIQTFATQILFTSELGVITAIDDWNNPIANNRNFDVKPIDDVSIKEETINGLSMLLVNKPTFPGIFNGFLNPTSKNLNREIYFDEEGNFKLDIEGKIKPDGILELTPKNELENPFCIIAGIKMPKVVIENTIQQINKIDDVYLHSSYSDTDGQTFVVFLDLKPEFHGSDENEIIEEVKEYVTDKLGKLTVFKEFIVVDNLPDIELKGKVKLNTKMLFDVAERIQDSEFKDHPHFEWLNGIYNKKTKFD